MRGISTGLTMIALTAALGCGLLQRADVPASIEVTSYKRDYSSAGVDPMPVGTAKQVARAKRIRASRRA